MRPRDMVIYVYEVRVQSPGNSGFKRGRVIRARSKEGPPKNWRDRVHTVRLARLAGGRSYWLLEFDAAPRK